MTQSNKYRVTLFVLQYLPEDTDNEFRYQLVDYDPSPHRPRDEIPLEMSRSRVYILVYAVDQDDSL